MKRLGNDRGSVIVFVVLFCTVLVAVAGLTMDFGSWYSEKQKLQGTADAAALAAAQDLPDTGTAATTATQYANDNNSGLNSWTPAFPNNYTVTIDLSKTAPAYFAKIVGVDSKTITAHSQAQVGSPTEMRNVLPIGVNQSAVCLTGSSGCFNVSKSLKFDDTTTASFHASTWGLMDAAGGSTSTSSCQGQASDSDITSWIQNGYQGVLPVNEYFGSVNGQKSTQNALNTQISKPLLVPVFDDAQSSWCQNPAKGGFHVVGWAALVIEQAIPDSDWGPHVKLLHVHFVEYIVHDVDSTPGFSGFGLKVIKLSQ
jgi:Flp pilus assembly protein TadG